MIDYNDLNFNNKKLSNSQKQVIFEQLYNYFNLQNSNFKNLAYQKDENGKLILPKGTLLHGTGETYGKKSAYFLSVGFRSIVKSRKKEYICYN